MFLKRNWAALTLAVLSGLGLIFAIVALSVTGSDYFYGIEFMDVTHVIALMVFFIGMLVYFILKMLGMSGKIRAIVLVVTGALVTLFFVLSIINACGNFNSGVEILGTVVGRTPNSVRVYTLFPLFCFMIALGLFPLVKGIKKICCCDKK